MEAWLRGNLNPLLDGQIAQPVEHSPEKAGVVGSIPTLTTLRKPGYLFKKRARAFFDYNPNKDSISPIFQSSLCILAPTLIKALPIKDDETRIL